MRRKLGRALSSVAVLVLLLNGVGCDKKTPFSPELLDSNADGLTTDEELDAVADDAISNPYRHEMAFEHVKPGEYSEVYLTFYVPDGTYQAILTGPAVAAPAKQTGSPNEDGFVYFVWRVYRYGHYEARVRLERPSKRPRYLFRDSVTVE
jgi:hypothetical protein